MTARRRVPALDSYEGWQLQQLMFGYAITGEVTETTALVGELGDVLVGVHWDRTVADLACQWLDGDRVPDWWALPWVTEQTRRQAVKKLVDSNDGLW